MPIEDWATLNEDERQRRTREFRKHIGKKHVKSIFPNATKDELKKILQRIKG